MPMDKSRYPRNWGEISKAIKDAAGWKCNRCGVEHDSYIVRDDHNPALYRDATDADFFDNTKHISHVLLTVHHKGVAKPDGSPGDVHDKMDNRPENLEALCQRCHLLADLPTHMANARLTRIRKKREVQLDAGQEELF